MVMVTIVPLVITGPLLRTMTRTPLGAVIAIAAAPSVYAAARGHQDLSVFITWAGLSGATCAGFAMDDAAEVTLSSCATPRSTRCWTRAALIAAAVALCWAAVAISVHLAGAPLGPVRGRLPETTAALAMSVAFASRLVRDGTHPAGLAAVMSTLMTIAASSALSLYVEWLPQVGRRDHGPRWWMVAALAALGAWWWSRDPAAPRSLRRVGRGAVGGQRRGGRS